MIFWNDSTFLLGFAVKGSLVVLLAALLIRVLSKRRSGADVASRTWLATFAALIALPILGIFPAAVSWPLPDGSALIADAKSTGVQWEDALSPAPALVDVPRSNPSAIGPWTLLWLIGASVVWLRLSVAHFRAAGLIRDAEPVEHPRLKQLLRGELESLGSSRSVELLTSKRITSPLVYCWPRPVILLPEGADRWPREHVGIVLRHEIFHLQRGDLATQLAAQVVCGLHWFNPLVWWAGRQFALAREQACDEGVLALGTPPTRYAELLLCLAQSQSRVTRPLIAVAPMTGRCRLQRRLSSILAFQNRPAAPWSLRILPAATILMFGCTTATIQPTDGESLTKPSAPSGIAVSVADGARTSTETACLGNCGDPSSFTQAEAQSFHPVDWSGSASAVGGPHLIAHPHQMKTVMRTLVSSQAEDVSRRIVELGLLSADGSLWVDKRTNTVVLREYASIVPDVLAAIDGLDDDC